VKLGENFSGIWRRLAKGDFREAFNYARKWLIISLRLLFRFSLEACFFVFVLLIGVTALALILKIKPLAEQSANAAYFALSAAIIIRIYRSLRHEKRD